MFKVDFGKAYDHVGWWFLNGVLEKKGFGRKWRNGFLVVNSQFLNYD